MKQEMMGCSVISWAICKSFASHARQINHKPIPHHWIFYRPDALPDAQPTVVTWYHTFSNAVVTWRQKYSVSSTFNGYWWILFCAAGMPLHVHCSVCLASAVQMPLTNNDISVVSILSNQTLSLYWANQHFYIIQTPSCQVQTGCYNLTTRKH